MNNDPSSLSVEEKAKALENLKRAFAPREVQGITLYPAFMPNANGHSRCLIHLEEFAHGNLPSDLIYIPGYQHTPVPVDHPAYLSSITYQDPFFNLAPVDRHDLLLCRESRQNSASSITPSVANPPVHCPGHVDRKSVVCRNAITNSEPDILIINVPEGGMILQTTLEEYTIANFSVYAKEHRLVYGKLSTEPITDEYELTVYTHCQSFCILVQPEDIANIVTLIQVHIPSCTVSTSVKKVKTLISNHVRNQLYGLPVRHYIRRTGFIHLQGQWVYAHDGISFPGSNLVFETGRTIPCDKSLPVSDSCQIALSFLEIAQKQEIILPLFLMAHLATLFNLYDAAGHVPRFLIFLNGASGVLKTATALCLFRLYWERPSHPESSFKDTITAHEQRLGEANSTVVVIDDYRPPVTSANGRQNLEKLESVIRHVGDRIGKSRSNAHLGKMREYIPSGCVVITGEDTGGSLSSLLRCCLISISKGDIDGSKLKPFQNNPLLLMTHMHHFVIWCGIHGDEIVNHIHTSFEAERQHFAEALTELRLADAAVTMMLTAQILVRYAVSVGAFSPDYQMDILTQWRDTIRQTFIQSEISSQELNPVTMYLLAVFAMLEQKEIRVARDPASYDPACHIGYVEENGLWLRTDDVYRHVRRFWQQRSIIFPLTQTKISEHLADAGLIEVSYETRGNGQKRLFSKKSALPNHPRLMVLNEDLARQYLENEYI